MRLRSLASLACLLLASIASAAEPKPFDWPQWRGPDRTGVSKETGLLKSWPKDGPPKLWTVTGCGEGFSSIAISGGVIYGTGLKDGKEVAWALNEADGKELWSTPFADNGQPGGPSKGPNSTPTVQDGRVYLLSSAGFLACLDAKTGKEIWHVDYKKDLGGKMMSGWGYSESVLIDGDKLICTPGGDKAAVVALKAATGEVIWKSEISKAGGAGYASPIKATINKVPMYITLLGKSGGFVAVHADTGKLLWQYNKVANGTANIPTAIVKGDLVWCSTGYGDGGAALLKVKAEGDTATVEEIKRYSSGELQNHHGGMVLVGDYVYFGSAHNQGHPACVEFKTGEIMWKENRGAEGGNGSAAVVCADGMLYYRYQNAVVVLMEANSEGQKVAGSFKIPEPSGKASWQHPVVANGKLYLRDQDKLHCFDVKAK